MIVKFKQPLLLGAVVAGLTLSIMGSGFKTSLSNIDQPWLAKVNGHYITEQDYKLSKEKLAGKLPEEQILSLMIDNALLIQRAQELGLIDSDRVVKKAIVHSTVEKLVHKAIAQDPSDATLKGFYQKNKNLFTHPDKFKIRMANHQTGNDALCQQDELVDDQGKVNQQWFDQEIQHPANQGFISQVLLHRHFGPSIAEHITRLQKGQLSKSFMSEGSCLSFILADRQSSQLANFENIKTKVLGEYRSQKRRKTLSDLLDQLKQNSDIQLATLVKEHTREENTDEI